MLGRFSVGKWTRGFSSFEGIQFHNLFLGKGEYNPGEYIFLGGGGDVCRGKVYASKSQFFVSYSR